ncbi:MAG: PLP-dependent aminotransferase family protein [Bacilli bacterium]|jgi:2-aminoadipate transaminase|nr:PLP-dependent aminotransferase family protein [Bacilli bacterium]
MAELSKKESAVDAKAYMAAAKEPALAKRMDDIVGTAFDNRILFEKIPDPEVIKFTIGSPAVQAIPHEDIAKIATDLLNNPENWLECLGYGPVEGKRELRESIAKELLAPKGVHVTADDILITVGGIGGLGMTVQACMNAGDVVLVENPTFIQAELIFDLYGIKQVGVDMDENGIIIEDLEAKIKKYNPKMLYTIPTFQNPSGRTLSRERREKIAQLAEQYDMFVLEDDPYRDIRFHGTDITPIKGFDKSGNVILINSFSKTFAPGLRLGYCVAEPRILQKIIDISIATNSHTPMLQQCILAEYFRRGLFANQVKRIADIYRPRCQALMDGIDKYFPEGTKRTTPEGGLFCWVTLPEGMDTEKLLMEARETPECKCAYITGEKSFVYQEGDKHITNCMRLAYGAIDEATIEAGCKRLGAFMTKKYEEMKNNK